MKLGVFTVPLYGKSTEDAFKYLSGLGVQAVEIGAGGYPGNNHIVPAAEMKALLAKYNLTISGISCHGNPVHPNKEEAKRYHEDFITACKYAQEVGIDTVIGFSGCPGDSPHAKNPNWVTCAWPPEYGDTLKFQWEEVLIPYWKEAVKIAESYGITKIALEMHPGFNVYNPSTLLRLREAVGPIIGANFDPSHLYWQGIVPTEAIKALKGAIYHFHAKDTRVDKFNTAVNGVLDTGSYGDMLGRSWLFRTVGFGHGESEWRDIISTLRAIGYDGALSIEHEDGLMSVEEGLEQAINFLKPMILQEMPADMWWA